MKPMDRLLRKCRVALYLLMLPAWGSAQEVNHPEPLSTHTFHVPAELLPPKPPQKDPLSSQNQTSHDGSQHEQTRLIQETLKKHHITFPEASLTVFDSDLELLTVRNTSRNLAAIAQLLTQQTPPLITLTASIVAAPEAWFQRLTSPGSELTDQTSELEKISRAPLVKGYATAKIIQTSRIEVVSGNMATFTMGEEHFLPVHTEATPQTQAPASTTLEPRFLGFKLAAHPRWQQAAQSIELHFTTELSSPIHPPSASSEPYRLQASIKRGSTQLVHLWPPPDPSKSVSGNIAYGLLIKADALHLSENDNLKASAVDTAKAGPTALAEQTLALPLSIGSEPQELLTSLETFLHPRELALPSGTTLRRIDPDHIQIRSTPELIHHAAHWARALCHQHPGTAAYTIQVASVPTSLAFTLIAESTAQLNHAAALTKVEESVASGTARWNTLLYGETKSGSTAVYRSGVETQIAGATTNSKGNATQLATARVRVGPTFEIEPVSFGGNFMTLRSRLQINGSNKPGSVNEVPNFPVMELNTLSALASATTRILCAWSPSSEKKDHMEIAFLTCHAVHRSFRDSLTPPPTLPPNRDNSNQLLTQTFKVPSDAFSSVDTADVTSSVQSVPPQERASFQQILERLGITFPEGAWAFHDPVSSVVILRNTSANLELMKLMTPPEAIGKPGSTSVMVEMFQADEATLRTLLQQAAGKHDHSAEWQFLKEGSASGKFVKLTALALAASQGRRSEISQGSQVSYIESGAFDEKSILEERRSSVQVGNTLETDTFLGPSGLTMDAITNLTHHTAPPQTRQVNLAPSDKPSMLVSLTDFFSTELNHLELGHFQKPRILAVWKPAADAREPDSANVLQIAIIIPQINQSH